MEITQGTLICQYVKFDIPVYCTILLTFILIVTKLKTMRTIKRPTFIHYLFTG